MGQIAFLDPISRSQAATGKGLYIQGLRGIVS